MTSQALDLASNDDTDIATLMATIGKQAKASARVVARAPSAQKDKALEVASSELLKATDDILAANALDMQAGEAKGLSAAMLDRLKLTPDRVAAIAKGLDDIRALKDPVGEAISEWDRPNGLAISRVRTPLGVIGVIFESRPNVTADAGALCLKAGNAVILRGGSDSYHSARAIHACLVEGLKAADLPEHTIQNIPTTDRAAVGAMLSGLEGCVDVIVPRGGKSLVARVQSEARVPVFAHLEGLCHIYVDESAELEMSVEIVANAKMRRTGICGSVETLLVDRAVADTHLPLIAASLRERGCELRGDEAARALIEGMIPATEEDWCTEYLDAILSVRIVDGIDEALDHIADYSSSHTEAVICEDAEVAERFFNEVDSAILLHNASTQFADGGEFGMGAEIGIATGKMHARGPVGVEQLTSFNYRVRGKGQTRT
ncbi:MAG: glutamate-5-semialdehyde dehydrogenase [Hyphomicrobiales bacterium]